MAYLEHYVIRSLGGVVERAVWVYRGRELDSGYSRDEEGGCLTLGEYFAGVIISIAMDTPDDRFNNVFDRNKTKLFSATEQVLPNYVASFFPGKLWMP